MTRKDYVTLARAFARIRPMASEPIGRCQWLECIDSVASALSADNPRRFNSKRFQRAASGEPDLTTMAQTSLQRAASLITLARQS